MTNTITAPSTTINDNKNLQWARAFTIFALYDTDGDVSPQHDEVYAGPDPSLVSPEHLAELETLGWTANDDYDCFHKFT